MFPMSIAKKKVTKVPGNPLPVPIEGFTGISDEEWPVYTAQVCYGDIVVTDRTHAAALYNNVSHSSM